MNKAHFQLLWTAVCWVPLLVLLVLRHLEVRNEERPPGPPGSIEYIRWRAAKEHEVLDEATKRTDPPKGADEPQRAKSVRPTQVKKSEREISENREVH